MKNKGTSNLLIFSLISLAAAMVYLFFVPKFGYFNDDWYLMYAAGAKGPSVFWEIFSVDRPLRALVMIPAYSLFGANPLYYNLGAFLFRLIGGFSFLWVLRMLWPGNHRNTLWMSLFFLLYPGFLSQPNAIDYFCHQAGLAAGMLSIGLTLMAIRAMNWKRKTAFYIISILLGWFCLSQIEWYIGLEFFRFACVFLFAFRLNETTWAKAVRFFEYALPVSLIPFVFLMWRLFYFQSERGATDVDMQLGSLRGEPLTFIFNSLSTLLDDFLDVIFRSWWLPLRRLSLGMNFLEWLPGLGISLTILALLWLAFKAAEKNGETEANQRSAWRREALWVGLGAVILGLFPVILVGRTVDFKSFSRYTLIASVGAAILLPLALSYVSSLRLRNVLFGILILLSSLTHYFNGAVKVRETAQMNQFWWQTSWRIPQMEQGTTLMVNYADITIEEDYFVWGPANLVYYPQSMHKDYPQPGIYSLLVNNETIEKFFAGEKKDFSNRRSIRTYPNYRNILILTQPTSASCVQVISGQQPEYSSFEDERIIQMSSSSDVGLIVTDGSFHQPPRIPFGLEPEHDWCFYYEKAALARQMGDWDQVLKLADEAFDKGLRPSDPIEWMPFLQAYALADDLIRLDEIGAELRDSLVAAQACRSLGSLPSLSGETYLKINKVFCNK